MGHFFRSPVKDQQVSKTPRVPNSEHSEKEKTDTEEVKSDRNDESEKVDKNDDIGQFTEHHSYSPARPAPSKHSLITTTPGILSKLKQLNYKPVHKSSKLDFQ